MITCTSQTLIIQFILFEKDNSITKHQRLWLIETHEKTKKETTNILQKYRGAWASPEQ